MASSSPASFKSQAHELSDQDLRSQVPFQTQVPYDRSPTGVREDRRLPPSSNVTPQYQPRSGAANFTSQNLRPSTPKDDGLDRQEPSDAQRQHQSPPSRVGAPERIRSLHGSQATGVDDEDESASSDMSIECQPLETNLERSTAVSAVEEGAIGVSNSGDQPFPLVEWIRRIRQETKPEWPTLPLRWARSIPKRQKAILDADDAWYPPLPGRPVRQGTIPIDILTALTRQVDQHVETKANKESHSSNQGLCRDIEQQTSISLPLNLPSSPPLPASVHESDVPWSSSPPSPPRRLLPPDTSPPRPPSNQEQSLANVNGPLRGVGQGNSATGRGGSNASPKTTQSPPKGSSQAESTQSSRSAQQQSKKKNEDSGRPSRITEASSQSQEKSLTSPVRGNPPINSSSGDSRLPETVPRSRPRVQVKHTPYPLKNLLPNRERYLFSDYMPQSSLVAGTYPEATIPNQRMENSPDPESEPSSIPASHSAQVNSPHASTQLASTIPQRPERLLKRTFANVSQDARPAITNPVSYIDRVKNSIPNKSRIGLSEEQPDEGDTRSARKQARHTTVQSPTSSEYRAEEELRVRNKERLIIQGIENRRAFRAPRSTSITIDGVKHVPLRASQALYKDSRTVSKGGVKFIRPSDPRSADEDVRAISVASSTGSRRPAPAVSPSEGEGTSATNLSLHNPSHVQKPSSRATSRRTSVNVAVSAGGLEKSFQRFVHAYPKYTGSLKSFEKALRLLVSLHAKPREPHPSLWDDFVFRMADDYKVYLQECIEEVESALPYQDFYHTRIKQSEHSNGVITEEGLKAATSSTNEVSTALKRASSVLLSHSDVVMVDVDIPNDEPPQVRATRQDVESTQDVQPSRGRGYVTRASSTSGGRKQNKTPSKKLSDNRGNTDKIRKRRSMPWSSIKSIPNKDALQIQQVEVLIPSGKQNHAATAVEQWLSRPAGACSPEIELSQIQNPEPEVVAVPTSTAGLPKSTRKRVSDLFHVEEPEPLGLHLPTYLASPKDRPAKITNNQSPDPLPSITASDILSQAERPVTPFTLFARNFANLQSEKSFRSLPGNKKRLPINLHDW